MFLEMWHDARELGQEYLRIMSLNTSLDKQIFCDVPYFSIMLNSAEHLLTE